MITKNREAVVSGLAFPRLLASDKRGSEMKAASGSPVCGKDGQSLAYLRTRFLVKGRFEIGDISISL